MRVVYLACPYSGDEATKAVRMEKFCRTVAKLTKLGTFVISPLFMHYVLPHEPSLGHDWSFWKNYSRELLSRSDEFHILCIEGWDQSEGIREETKLAEELGKPVEKIPASFVEHA